MTDTYADFEAHILDDGHRLFVGRLPEDLRPEATDLLNKGEDSESPSGAQAPDDSGLSDNERQHAGQVSEPTTEMAPADDPGATEPSG